jgi:hypothetical protein
MQDNQKYKAYKLLYELIQIRDEAIFNFKQLKSLDNDSSLPLFEIPWISQWIRYANSDLLKRQFGVSEDNKLKRPFYSIV